MTEWFTELQVNFAKWFAEFQAKFALNFIDENRWKFIVNGLWVTLQVTFFALIIGVVLGVVVAVIRSSHEQAKPKWNTLGGFLINVFNAIFKVYLTVIRGTPVMVQLLIINFIILASSSNKMLVCIIAFGVNSGAYVAEIVRAGIMSVPRGQMEAGRSLGLNYIKTMWFIIVPQAFKNVLPSLANEFIVLLKETSISGYIGLGDLTRGGDIIRGRTFEAFMPLIAVALIYLIMVMFFTWLVGKLERRLRNSDHR